MTVILRCPRKARASKDVGPVRAVAPGSSPGPSPFEARPHPEQSPSSFETPRFARPLRMRVTVEGREHLRVTEVSQQVARMERSAIRGLHERHARPRISLPLHAGYDCACPGCGAARRKPLARLLPSETARCTADPGPRLFFMRQITGVPRLQRITPLRSVLRCARDTRRDTSPLVMPGLVPGIHVLKCESIQRRGW